MQLFTANNFTVVRQLQDPSTVGNTYYVQAVIRNAYTDTIIGTLKLTNKGSQRFKFDWKVPEDPSGEGFYVSIVTSVYSDSAYTTKSTDYGDEENTYLVSDKPRTSRGGGQGLSRSDVREIMREEIKKALPDEEAEEMETEPVETLPDRWDELLEAIQGIEREPEDNSEVLTVLAELSSMIKGLNIPELNVQPVLEALSALEETFENNHSEIKERFENSVEGMKKIADQAITNVGLENQAAVVKERIAQIEKAEEEVEPEEETVDITKLST